MNEFRRLRKYAKPYQGLVTVALLAMVVYAIGSAGVAAAVQPIGDNVLGSGTGVAWVAMLILASYFAKGLGAYASGYLMADVGQRVVRDLRNQLFRHTLDQSAAFFSRRTSGQLVSRITNDVNQVQNVVAETVADLIRESLAIVGYVILMFAIDWHLALVCLTAAPLVVYPLARLGQKVRSTSKRSQEELGNVTHIATEGLAGHRIVKAFGAEAREAKRFADASHRLYRTNMKIMSALSALPPIMELIGGLAAIGAVWYGASRISQKLITPGEFMSFLTAAFLMYTPIKKLSRVNAAIQQAIASAQRIFELLDTHSEVKETPNAPSLAPLRSQVEFREVAFSYDDEPGRYVLRHVNLTVRSGQVAAIVGLSGAGKTTLVNLIPRFYDVTEGGILVDGVDIRSVSLKSLRAQTALVTQETVLFDDTIASNIAYGVPDASRERIEAAARAAHAHEFVRQLPSGYDERIGERGQRLSGGQRQRIAIARAILKDCPLLVLDEATSALDAESELLVQDALANLMKDRTTFVIAHRMSTVRRADLIIALEGGEIAEIGTHDELVSRPGGVYAKLYALQAFEERDVERTPDSTEGILM
ncbi:MAG TPA: ABC transporter ATP-binding protein [Vicinamibacterales bacterium]|nr:ABC transporter ATP-binding protein [Vicinamibacterales bacterium]